MSKLVSSYVKIGEHPATSLTLSTGSPLKQFPASQPFVDVKERRLLD